MMRARSIKAASSPRNRAINRIPVTAKLMVTMALSILAFGEHTLITLSWLTAAELFLLILAGSSPSSFWPKAKVFFWQTAVIVGLHFFRFGPSEGLWPGIRISWQLFLAYLPGTILVDTTSESRMMRVLSRIMSSRMAFVLTTCLRFVPLVLDEIRRIYEGQVLRGARILPKDILSPGNWPDLIHCLVVPAMVQSMNLAGEIALAAKARGFGMHNKRTCWPET